MMLDGVLYPKWLGGSSCGNHVACPPPCPGPRHRDVAPRQAKGLRGRNGPVAINCLSTVAQETNKKQPNKKTWDGAPATHQFSLPPSRRRSCNKKQQKNVPGLAQRAGTRNLRQAGSKRRLFIPHLDCAPDPKMLMSSAVTQSCTRHLNM